MHFYSSRKNHFIFVFSCLGAYNTQNTSRKKKGIRDEGIKANPWSKQKIPIPMRISQIFHEYSLREHVSFYEVGMPISEIFFFTKWVILEKTAMLRDGRQKRKLVYVFVYTISWIPQSAKMHITCCSLYTVISWQIFFI